MIIDFNLKDIGNIKNLKVCETSVNRYYQHYKSLNKIIDQNEFTETMSSTYTTLLDKSTKLNLMPCKMGIIKSTG